MSVLSHEYQALSDLSQPFNVAVVTLKKARLGLPGSADELEPRRRQIATTIEAIISLLTPNAAVAQQTVAFVPSALVASLQAAQQDDLPYYVEALEQVLHRLGRKGGAITDLDVARLDELAAVLDAVTSSAYRQMMRA